MPVKTTVESLPKVHKKRLTRKRLLIGGTLFLSVFAFVIFSSYGIWTRVSLESKKNRIVEQIQTMQLSQDSLRTRIKVLQNDMNELERIAREQYGMVAPGEQVFILKKDAE